jgi:type VII secretion-associated serine protease mycosin
MLTWLRAAATAATCAVLSATALLSAPVASADNTRDSQDWVLNMVDARSAWQFSTGAHVTVAVIDSGVYADTSDISGSVLNGPDYTGLRTSRFNAQWGAHGTWMASIIAGHGHDSGLDGIIGIAPQAKILSIRVIPDKDDPNYHVYNDEPEQRIQQELANGIRTAVRDHAQVISMSIGYSAPSGVVRAALQYAYSHGVVLVASSGNSGGSDQQQVHGWAPVSFPAEYPGVLSVGAVDENWKPANFSSNNLSVKIAAPGYQVPAEGRNGIYYYVSGTSPACALVAGVAALIKSRYPKISPNLVTEAMITTARRGPGAARGYNPATGFGVVDAAAALTAASHLVRKQAEGSVVKATAHFGGGPAAVPAPPVAPRGSGQLVLFTVLAVLSLAAAGGGAVALRRRPL